MLDIDQKDIPTTQEQLRLGIATPFWRLVCLAVDESIERLQQDGDSDEIRDLPAEQYKLEMELLKAKQKYLRHLKNLPASLIEYLSEPSGNTEKEKNYDPFYSTEELRAELSKKD